MNGQHTRRFVSCHAGKHVPGLLGCRVGVVPRVVGTDAKDGKVDRASGIKRVGVCGIACKKDVVGGVRGCISEDEGRGHDVTIKASGAVEGGACAPVRWTPGRYL